MKAAAATDAPTLLVIMTDEATPAARGDVHRGMHPSKHNIAAVQKKTRMFFEQTRDC